jgi:predicted DNA-binding protein
VYVDLPKELAARFKTEVKTRGDTVAKIFRQAIEDYLNPKETEIVE